MSHLWSYNPDKCDGDLCPNDCDYCPKRNWEEVEDDESEGDSETGDD